MNKPMFLTFSYSTFKNKNTNCFDILKMQTRRIILFDLPSKEQVHEERNKIEYIIKNFAYWHDISCKSLHTYKNLQTY